MRSCDRQSSCTRRRCSSGTQAQPRSGWHSLLAAAGVELSGRSGSSECSERRNSAACAGRGARVLSRYSTAVRAPSAAIALESSSVEPEPELEAPPVWALVQKREITTVSQLTHTLCTPAACTQKYRSAYNGSANDEHVNKFKCELFRVLRKLTGRMLKRETSAGNIMEKLLDSYLLHIITRTKVHVKRNGK